MGYVKAGDLKAGQIGYAEEVVVDDRGRTWIENPLSLSPTFRAKFPVRRNAQTGKVEVSMPQGATATRASAIFAEVMVPVELVMPDGGRVNTAVPPARRRGLDMR